MIDLDFDPPADDQVKAPDIVPIFLGLFLLVLAFFIMLVSISTFEKVKSNAVMDSLSSTFTTVLPPTTDLTDFNAKDGDILAGEAFQEQITTIFSTAIQVEKIEVVQPGKLMRLRIPTPILFKGDETTLRQDQLPLMDRVVAALSNRSPGLRQDMEIVVGANVNEKIYLPEAQNIEMARLGELARTLVGRGAPPDSISVGIKNGSPNEINLWFWVRPVEETATLFDDALKEMKARNRPPLPVRGPPLRVRQP